MPNEDPNLNGNAKPTPEQERESEEAKELAEIVAALEGADQDEPPTREEFNNLFKGVKKLATKIGRTSEPKPTVEVKTEVKSSDDNTELFYLNKPDAELVSDDLEAVAKAKYGGSVIQAWKNEQWLQEKSLTLSNAKKEKEELEGKIKSPANGNGGAKGSIALQDIDLAKPEHVAYLNSDPKLKAAFNKHLLESLKRR